MTGYQLHEDIYLLLDCVLISCNKVFVFCEEYVAKQTGNNLKRLSKVHNGIICVPIDMDELVS